MYRKENPFHKTHTHGPREKKYYENTIQYNNSSGETQQKTASPGFVPRKYIVIKRPLLLSSPPTPNKRQTALDQEKNVEIKTFIALPTVKT